jgi:hypothetical protein
MALIDTHTILNTILIAGAAFVGLMLLRLVLRTAMRILSIGCLGVVGVAVIIGVARWVA